MKGEMVPGSVRNGGGLLAGLLRCGHCGRKLKVITTVCGVWRAICSTTLLSIMGRRTKCIAFGNMLRQIELALEQVRYEAARAHRQYDAVDPDNRLVAGDLERRWNERLAEVARLETELRLIRENLPAAITDAERTEILALL